MYLEKSLIFLLKLLDTRDMAQIMSCPICNSEKGSKFLGYAVISPWIRKLIACKATRSSLFNCLWCRNSWFTYRYSFSEMESIYSDYRGNKYLRIRNEWEPWYNENYNDGHFAHYFVSTRKAAIAGFIEKYLDAEELFNIIDVGGDIGQFIPDFAQSTLKYVFDVSDKVLANGVERISNEASIKNMDLVISAHVLEHLDRPLDEIKKLLTFGKNLYVEVPLGYPESNRRRRSYTLNRFAVAAAKNHFLWRNLTSPSAGRDARGAWLKTSILRQSEHINFFSLDGFSKLLKSIGVEYKIEVSEIPAPDGASMAVLQILIKQ